MQYGERERGGSRIMVYTTRKNEDDSGSRGRGVWNDAKGFSTAGLTCCSLGCHAENHLCSQQDFTPLSLITTSSYHQLWLGLHAALVELLSLARDDSLDYLLAAAARMARTSTALVLERI